MTEEPIAIVVTLPARFFLEYDHRKYLRELHDMNNTDQIWYRVCKNLPKHTDLLYVYTIIGNKVHHRANFAGVERNKDYAFTRPGGKVRRFNQANAILTCGPVVFPDKVIPMTGFQGFRYLTKELF